MRIESVHASGSRPTSPPDHSLMSQPAPAHVDTLRWKLADASERRQLMATHAGRPQPHAEPAPQASSAPSSLLHAPLAAGVFLLLLMLFFGDWVARIPMAALVAVMIMVSIGTFSWDSLRNLRKFPLSTNIVMVATVVVVVFTHKENNNDPRNRLH